MHVSPLEPRRLFSAGLTTTPPPYARLDDNSVLRIFGSDVGERIDIRGFYGETIPTTLKPTTWTVVVQPTDSDVLYDPAFALLEFDIADVSRIAVYGGDGDDVILGNTARNRLEGGGGRDFILGGAGYDTLFGGSGDDTFWTVDSRDGMPWIVVNEGDPGRAEDKIYGGRGKDFARTDGWDTLDSVETEFELP